MEGYIGRPLDDTTGTVKEIMVNYHSGFHYNFRSMLEAMPHTDFIIFDGPSPEETKAMANEKLRSIDLRKYGDMAVEWANSMRGDINGFVEMGKNLVLRKNMMKVTGQESTPEYLEYSSFLDGLALIVYTKNLRNQQVKGLYAEHLVQDFPGRTEIVKVKYPLSHFARDSLISLKDGDERVIIPSNQGICDDLMSQLDYRLGEMADNPVWERRGYRRGDDLEVKEFVGGNIVANGSHVFLGMSAYLESMLLRGKEWCDRDIGRITGDSELVYLESENPGFTYHADVMLMPGKGGKVYVSDPIETRKRLESAGIKTDMDRKLLQEFAGEIPSIKRQLKSRGFKTRSAPFWITTHMEYPFMFAYVNNIQETDKVYAPSYRNGANKRIIAIGEVLDDWFFDMVSGDKEVSPIEGFGFPSMWNTGGIRCVNNVVRRD